MALDFPSSPTLGQQVTIGGVTWTWDGVKWTAGGTGSGVYVPLTGGTMTGDLILNRDPVVALGAATKQSVDARGAGDNRLINGDMRIDQRNNGASGTASGYTVDRWQYFGSQTGKGTWARFSVTAPGFPNALYFISSSAYASIATDTFEFYQAIEADAISDFSWGTANAQPVTLSFWVLANGVTGTFSGSLQNYAGTRTYPFTFSIPTTGVWTKIAITIPGDTTGTWVMSGNAGSLYVQFDLGCGSSKRGPAGAWASANYIGATGSASVVATNGAQFMVTGVKLEIGSVATPYNRQSLAKSMADCQRYYQIFSTQMTAYLGAAGNPTAPIFYQPMRASPTGVLSNLAYGNATALAVSSLNPQAGVLALTQSGAGFAFANYTLALSAEL